VTLARTQTLGSLGGTVAAVEETGGERVGGERVGSELAELRWPDLATSAGPARVLVAVPVGSCEQHGPHLPLGTDTIVATALATALAARRDDVVVAPALAITSSGEHAGFPGTLSIGRAVMETVVVELVRSAGWSRGVVLVNGHGGNRAAVDAAVATLHREGRRVLAWWPRVPGGDPHAGHTETSIVLALSPLAVRLDAAVAGPVPTFADLVRHGVAAASESGVLGDPTGASAEHGRELLHRLTDDLVHAVAGWRDE
jgi:mycofactocin system creatininase family protein